MTAPLFVTIDSHSTQDIDDALSITPTDDGYVVHVAIADPSEVVGVGTDDDKMAFERAASIYSKNRTVQTMLPRDIGTDKASLVAGKPRQAMVFTINLDSGLEVVGFQPRSQVITVSKRLTYEGIPGIIRGPQSPLRDMMSLLCKISTHLLERRRSRGALALFDLAKLMLSDEDGNLRHYDSADEIIGHIIVQEFMILTNAQIALFMAENGLPAIYRNHSGRVSAPSSAELASTVEQWLKEGVMSQANVGSHLGALIERALYESVARGHYGLGLPLYLHGTSPLRRYADLVNIRQLRSHLENRPLPYGQADLALIATSITSTLRERSESSRDYHKDMLTRKAQLQIASGNLTSMEDHVLSAAVKLAKEVGHLPDAVVAELIRRLNSNSIADAIVDRLAIQIPRQAITEELGAAFSAWMSKHPHNVVRIIMNGTQTQVFKDLDEAARPSKKGFTYTVSLTLCATDERLSGTATASEKRVAKQRAMVEIICRLLHLPITAAVEAPPGKSPVHRVADPKGALIELCRKRGWSPPHFQVSMSGPSNAATFQATATVIIKGSGAETVTSPPLPTKKAAEAAAAGQLVDKLIKEAGQHPAAGRNAVMELNEFAQKRKLAEAGYVFAQLTIAPPSFQCEAKLTIGQHAFSACMTASAKKTAKEQAAADILSQVQAFVTARAPVTA